MLLKPRLTDKVLHGILNMYSVASAGSVADFFGHDGPEECRLMDESERAAKRARDILEYRRRQRGQKSK